MVGLFLFVIFNIFPSTLQIIAGIFESNMCFGSIISCLLLRRFITREGINRNNRNNTDMIDNMIDIDRYDMIDMILI